MNALTKILLPALACFGTCVVHALDGVALKSMVIVEGDNGSGSAFFMKMDGTTWLVTNSHVVRGNHNVKFRTLNNETIKTAALQIADKVDAVRAAVETSAPTLEMETQIEDRVKIGDAVVVMGNAEGQGVVREIPGKVVGIGPDRIEVDAAFVPGNSGSPILLTSTGRVIGIATYAVLPRVSRNGSKSPMSLNEVRRFGFRLDTVARWISPQPEERVVKEGLKLEQMENLMRCVGRIINDNARSVVRNGLNHYLNKSEVAESPGFKVVAEAINAFVKAHTAALSKDAQKKNVTVFFDQLRTALVTDAAGFNAGHFSGYYALQFQEEMNARKEFFDWFEGTSVAAYRDEWLESSPGYVLIPASKPAAPPVDPTKLNFKLTEYTNPSEPLNRQHHVSYPLSAKPANTTGIFWVIENEGKVVTALPMKQPGLRVGTPRNGSYRIYIEYRGGQKPRLVSNILEIKVTGITATDGSMAGASGEDGDTAPTAAVASSMPALKEFKNSLGMKFVPVPGTKIVICIHETRRKDYAAYVKENLGTDKSWQSPVRDGVPLEQGDEHPVQSVSWEDARAFCAWLAAKEKRTYRLPTDRDWSMAAGIGDREAKGERVGVMYSWGAQWPPPKDSGNFGDKAFGRKFPNRKIIEDYDDGFATSAPVMHFKPNQFGLYDLSGNVWEWCEDWYKNTHKYHVLRGGGWREQESAYLLLSNRSFGLPTEHDNSHGFRIVAE